MAEEKKNGAARAVRPCRAGDLQAARAICEETSSIALRDEKDRRFLLLTYCDAYVLYSTDCFVAQAADGRVVGYVFCAADTRRFFRAFRKNVLPELKRLGLRYGLMGRGVCVQQTLCSVFAPAHLHIDLTASARRQGVGTALIEALKARLAARGIDRVVLTVNRKNVAAVRFYEKNGFRPVVKAFGACVMRADTAGDRTAPAPRAADE